MNSTYWKSLAIWQLKTNLGVWIVNGVLLIAFSIVSSGFLQVLHLEFFSKLTFVETGVFLIIGGLVAFSGSVSATKSREFILKSNERWSIEKLRASEKRSIKFLILGVTLFVESLLISFLGY
jgi:hypothetical protein